MSRASSFQRVLWAAALLGCTSHGGQAAPPAGRAAPAAPAGKAGAAPAALAGPQEALTALVPEDAVAAVIVRKNALAFLRSYLDADPALTAELSAYLTQRLGVDPTSVEGAVLFLTTVSDKPQGALVLRLPGPGGTGTLKGEKAGQFGGVDLVRVAEDVVGASLPNGLALGDERSVRAAIALASGQQKPIAPGGKLQALLSAGADAAVLLAAHAPGIQLPGVQAQVEQYGVASVVATYTPGGKITLTAKGDPAKLAAARDLLRQFVQTSMAEAEKSKDQAKQGGDTWEAATLIIGYHQTRRLWEAAEPKLVGDELRVGYQAPVMEGQDLMVATAMIGILGAVAVPSFMKYSARAKATEMAVPGEPAEQGERHRRPHRGAGAHGL